MRAATARALPWFAGLALAGVVLSRLGRDKAESDGGVPWEDESYPERDEDISPVVTVDSPKRERLPSPDRLTRGYKRPPIDTSPNAPPPMEVIGPDGKKQVWQGGERVNDPLTDEEREAIEAARKAIIEAEGNVTRDPGPLPPLEPYAPVPKAEAWDTSALPPQSGGPLDLEGALREMKNVARHIYNAGGGYKRFKSSPRAWAQKAKGNYKRKVVRDWQEKAGLVPDGLYGPKTRAMMIELGAPEPPPALFVLRKGA